MANKYDPKTGLMVEIDSANVESELYSARAFKNTDDADQATSAENPEMPKKDTLLPTSQNTEPSIESEEKVLLPASQNDEESSHETYRILQELKKQPTTETQPAELEQRRLSAELTRLRTDEYRRYISLRTSWSTYISWILFIMVWFHIILTLLVGLEFLTYRGNEVFVNLALGQNFLMIIGLAYIVVKFLFPRSDTGTKSSRSEKLFSA